MRAYSLSYRRGIFSVRSRIGACPTTMDRLGPKGLLLETLRIDYRFTQNDLCFNFNDPELQNVSIEFC